MARKNWTPQTDITPSLLKLREKRRWQISLRRYILEKNLCPPYAPYFGLDIENFRNWIQLQFDSDLTWDNFSSHWQFGHMIPVTYFDFSKDAELKLCWNFTNIRVERLDKGNGSKSDVISAKGFFEELYRKTGYSFCLELLAKINRIELSEASNTKKQEAFIISKKNYLSAIASYTSFEFELINRQQYSVKEEQKELE
jgi:hypothetical protein